MELSKEFNFILDSGGFTNYWQSIRKAAYGKASRALIDINEYINFCHGLEHEIYGYVALDLPRNQEVTLDNLEKMVKSGLSPMPVFAEGVPYEMLDEFLTINERICVAGSVQSSDRYTIQRYQKVMLHTDKKAKIHALGFGRWPFILNVPIKTCDSSTWTNGVRYGAIGMFMPDTGFSSIRRPGLLDPKSKKKSNVLRILGYLKRCNVTFDDLNDNEQWKATTKTPSLPSATHAFAYLQFIYYLRRVYGVEYFYVLAHLGKSAHFATILGVLVSTKDDLSTFDYQKFKRNYRNFMSIPKGEEFDNVVIRVLEDFYGRLSIAS